MTEEREPTREDQFLKIRLVAEGVRYAVKNPPPWKRIMDGWDGPPDIILDGCGVYAMTRANPHSALELTIDGKNVTVSEMGKFVTTAQLEPPVPWADKAMSDGGRVGDFFSGTRYSSYLTILTSCYVAATGQACKFCSFGAAFEGASMPANSVSEQIRVSERLIEAVVIAVKNGLDDGLIILEGGAPAPDQRGQYQTDLYEAVIGRFRESLDDETFARLRFHPHTYPPGDLKHLEKWKHLGISSVLFDSQVMDPAYFKAICPGRGDQRVWFEAQEAAVEVFGSCSSNLVTGIEPMAGMLEGIEERVSKGVQLSLGIFQPKPGTPMAGMQPASAEWYMEAFEKANEIRYGREQIDGAPQDAYAF